MSERNNRRGDIYLREVEEGDICLWKEEERESILGMKCYPSFHKGG